MAISNSALAAAIHAGGGERIRKALTAFTAVEVDALPADANATLTANSGRYQVANAPITANRTVTLPASGAAEGQEFHVVRTAASTGAFTLTVAGKALTAGQWAQVVYSGTAWVLVSTGTL